MDKTAGLYAGIGKRVRTVRERLGLTQKGLGSLVHLTRTSITNIERGKQRILVHTLVDLAKALKVAPGELLISEDARIDVVADLEELLKHRPRIERDWIKATIGAAGKEG
jgi:transcriptional regulator with XRE-family HTH domain